MVATIQFEALENANKYFQKFCSDLARVKIQKYTRFCRLTPSILKQRGGTTLSHNLLQKKLLQNYRLEDKGSWIFQSGNERNSFKIQKPTKYYTACCETRNKWSFFFSKQRVFLFHPFHCRKKQSKYPEKKLTRCINQFLKVLYLLRW